MSKGSNNMCKIGQVLLWTHFRVNKKPRNRQSITLICCCFEWYFQDHIKVFYNLFHENRRVEFQIRFLTSELPSRFIRWRGFQKLSNLQPWLWTPQTGFLTDADVFFFINLSNSYLESIKLILSINQQLLLWKYQWQVSYLILVSVNFVKKWIEKNSISD